MTDTAKAPLADDELQLIDAYWRAANYLSVGQIYLLDNPLLREPLLAAHQPAARVGVERLALDPEQRRGLAPRHVVRPAVRLARAHPRRA